ncbi:MAG: acyl-CoA dehydrogenase family protein [Candidatus Dormibacteraceae bacterium]
MSTEVSDLLAASAGELFARHCPTELMAEPFSPELWRVIEKAELVQGAELPELAAVVRVAAQFAAPVPLGETWMLAHTLLAQAGIAAPAGPLTAAEFVGGRSPAVPYARFAAGIVAVTADGVALLDPSACGITPGANFAGEPRDAVAAGTFPVTALPPSLPFRTRGALLRSVQMAGALERVLQLTVEHAGGREQFGQPLRKFQAVGHQLAELAAEVAAARAAADAAVLMPQPWHIAAAKVRCGAAAGRAAAIAHQVHGAIGFTDEHVLHHFTLRLWSWRDEFGTEAEWASDVHKLVGKDVWRRITDG